MSLFFSLGNISGATMIEAAVILEISFIFEPPFPMSEPHSRGRHDEAQCDGRSEDDRTSQRFKNFLQMTKRIRHCKHISALKNEHKQREKKRSEIEREKLDDMAACWMEAWHKNHAATCPPLFKVLNFTQCYHLFPPAITRL